MFHVIISLLEKPLSQAAKGISKAVYLKKISQAAKYISNAVY